jgi:hypothetical protein
MEKYCCIIYHENHDSDVALEIFEWYQMFNEQQNRFYTYLVANQEELGAEFEKVLYENLWDLYEN